MQAQGFLELFAELAEVLSAESAVVMTSRVSFLGDSPQVRRLMDGTSLMSEKLIQQLHAEGVDPLRVPRFSVLRLRDEKSGGSLLGAKLASEMGNGGQATSSGVSDALSLGGTGSQDNLDELLWRHIRQVVDPALLPRVVEVFGSAFLRGVTTFSLVDLVNELGIAVFEGGRVSLSGFRLMEIFRPAGPAGGRDATGADGAAVAFLHTAYQELLAAEFLRTTEGRAAAVTTASRPRLTEQVRQFLYRTGGGAARTDDCVLPVGVYVVGPGHHLMLRRIEQPVRLDRFPCHCRPVQAVPRRRRPGRVGAVGSSGHASGLYPRAMA